MIKLELCDECRKKLDEQYAAGQNQHVPFRPLPIKYFIIGFLATVILSYILISLTISRL